MSGKDSLLTKLADQDEVIHELRKSNTRLVRQLSSAKAQKIELAQAIYQAAVDNVQSLDFPEAPEPSSSRHAGPADKRPEEYAVAVLSDWQLAKVTPSYNSDVCRERVALYGDKLIELTNIQRAHHTVRKLRVYLAGDLVEGELIFPGQSYLIDASLYQQVCKDGPEILCRFLERMAKEFDEVHVAAAIGNHGALGGKSRRDYNPETNADRMLYKIAQTIMDAKGYSNITWNIPDGGNERNWYATDTIGDKSFMIMHGDQIRGGFAGMPWYGFLKKVYGWNAGAIDEKFDYVICGHWHQAASFPLNKIMVYVNGSTESHNTYAAEQLAATGHPSQWLMFVHPKRGITAEYRVWLHQA